MQIPHFIHVLAHKGCWTPPLWDTETNRWPLWLSTLTMPFIELPSHAQHGSFPVAGLECVQVCMFQRTGVWIEERNTQEMTDRVGRASSEYCGQKQKAPSLLFTAFT